MKPKITSKQLVAIYNLLNGLQEFERKGLGRISNIITMVNFGALGDVFVRYEKEYGSSGEMFYEFRIAQIDKEGNVLFIDENFKNMFERSAFLGECKIFNIEDESQYEKI